MRNCTQDEEIKNEDIFVKNDKKTEKTEVKNKNISVIGFVLIITFIALFLYSAENRFIEERGYAFDDVRLLDLCEKKFGEKSDKCADFQLNQKKDETLGNKTEK